MNNVQRLWITGLLSTVLAQATTIILQFRDDVDVRQRVILATDSMGVVRDSSGVSTKIQCKIAVLKRFVFAFAGPVQNKSAGFDAYRDMELALQQPGSFAAKMQAFEHRVLMNLNTLENGTKTLEVVAIDTDHFPRHYLGVFTPSRDGTWRIQPESGIREKLGYPVRYLLLGVRDHIATELTTTPRRFEDTAAGVASLIEVEERSHPDLVGGVVTMVKIQNGVIEWLSPGVCESNGQPVPRSLGDAPITFR
jgi:hypothetical protein